MARIYISSTYVDLIEQRLAVRDAVLGLGHFPVGMEDYASSDERPLDKCVGDVGSCQAYVGIVAWRYGFKPNGGGKSITQLEYEAAVSSNIPCYLFLLDAEAPWPPPRMPLDERPLVVAFRERLSTEKTVKFFKDSSELARFVAQSLATGRLTTVNRPSPPDLLPYLCDRSRQELELDEVIKRSRNLPSRPVLCVVHGDEREAHDKFLERVQKVMLPLFLAAQTEHAGIQSFHLEWPADYRDEPEMHRRLELSLSKEVLDSALGTRADINERLYRCPGPVVVHSHVITEYWTRQGPDCFNQFCRFWETWPTLAVGQELFVFLYFKYQSGRHLGWLRSRQYRKINNAIRTHLEQASPSARADVTATIMSELVGATLGETQDWARSEAVRRFCDPQALVTAIAIYFSEWEARARPRTSIVRIPMEELAPKLRELMSRVQTSSIARRP